MVMESEQVIPVEKRALCRHAWCLGGATGTVSPQQDILMCAEARANHRFSWALTYLSVWPALFYVENGKIPGGAKQVLQLGWKTPDLKDHLKTPQTQIKSIMCPSGGSWMCRRRLWSFLCVVWTANVWNCVWLSPHIHYIWAAEYFNTSHQTRLPVQWVVSSWAWCQQLPGTRMTSSRFLTICCTRLPPKVPFMFCRQFQALFTLYTIHTYMLLSGQCGKFHFIMYWCTLTIRNLSI